MTIIDLVDPAELTGYVREVPSPANYVLNQILPDVPVANIEAEITNVTKTNRAAKFRSWDAETPIGKRPKVDSRKVKLPPLGQKTVIGEYETIQLNAARLGGNGLAAIVDEVYNDAENNTLAVLARMELARGDVLTDGVVTIDDENGLEGLEADYGVDSSHLVDADVSFDDWADADPVEEITGWVATYVADAGERPAVAWTSQRVLSNLLRNESIRQLAATVAGTPGIVSQATLDAVFQAYGLPLIRTYDTLIDVDGVSERPIPDDRMVFVPADTRSLGYTAWGVTAEALELVGTDNPSIEFEQAPGLTGVVLKTFDPVRRWTKVGAVGMPIIEDPRKLLVARVIIPGS